MKITLTDNGVQTRTINIRVPIALASRLQDWARAEGRFLSPHCAQVLQDAAEAAGFGPTSSAPRLLDPVDV